jgi:hypothetical protein
MISGAQSAFEEMVSLRSYGRVVARSDDPAFLLRWSEDSQTVSYRDSFSVTMGEFRHLPEHFISQLDTLCSEMMFDWRPSVDLSRVKDDMTNTVRGYSFVQHPDNQLQSAYLELMERACTHSHRGLMRRNGSWNRRAVDAYLKLDNQIRAAFAGGMQLTGGQVARCRELLSLWCCNTEFGLRSIFAWNGYIMFVVRHHKAKQSMNREFIVARILPAPIGLPLFKYLAYIRPAVDVLYRDVVFGRGHGEPELSPLLFRANALAGSEPWSTSRLTTVITSATKKV